MSTITRIDDSTIEIAQPRANRMDRFRWDEAASDPGPWMYQANGGDDTIRPEEVAYGRTVYYGAFACSSAQDGLTCWDSVSAAGVKMNRAGVTEL